MGSSTHVWPGDSEGARALHRANGEAQRPSFASGNGERQRSSASSPGCATAASPGCNDTSSSIAGALGCLLCRLCFTAARPGVAALAGAGGAGTPGWTARPAARRCAHAALNVATMYPSSPLRGSSSLPQPLMRKKLSAKWMCARTSGTPPRDSRSSNSGMSWSAPLPSTAPPALARTAAAAHCRRHSSLALRGVGASEPTMLPAAMAARAHSGSVHDCISARCARAGARSSS